MFNPNNRMSNRIHLNCSFEKENDVITKSTVMVNIFEWNVSSAIKLYRDILKELSEESVVIDAKTENGQSIQPNTKKIEFFTAPECPDHKVPMVIRTRKSDGIVFFGCSKYREGCRKTAPNAINREIATKIPSISSFER